MGCVWMMPLRVLGTQGSPWEEQEWGWGGTKIVKMLTRRKQSTEEGPGTFPVLVWLGLDALFFLKLHSLLLPTLNTVNLLSQAEVKTSSVGAQMWTGDKLSGTDLSMSGPSVARFPGYPKRPGWKLKILFFVGQKCSSMGMRPALSLCPQEFKRMEQSFLLLTCASGSNLQILSSALLSKNGWEQFSLLNCFPYLWLHFSPKEIAGACCVDAASWSERGLLHVTKGPGQNPGTSLRVIHK